MKGRSSLFTFRNGKKVSFVAHAVKTEELLSDIKAYLKSDPGQLDWQKVNLGQIGWRIVHNGETKYLGAEVAKWDLELEPREKHFDKRITVSTPLQKAGAYMLTATMENGNVSKILVWVADTAIAQKMLDGKTLYYVADAVDGTPVAGANLEFFGYKQTHLGNNRWKIETSNFAEDCQCRRHLDPRSPRSQAGLSVAHHLPHQARAVRLLRLRGRVERPLLRPGLQHREGVHDDRSSGLSARSEGGVQAVGPPAQYDQDSTSEFAKQSFPVEIHNPKGEKIYSQVLETDEFGGLVGELPLPKDAPLGMYNIVLNKQMNNLQIHGGNSFRVEEYKKPEFEVTIDSPKEPVMLGEKIDAKIKAKYYFGSPVTNAKVKYKITRVSHTQNWYPTAPWDWCFGRGYWWFAYDYGWYPGFNEWCGCKRPYPIWWGRGQVDPPELISDMEVDVGPEGEWQCRSIPRSPRSCTPTRTTNTPSPPK